MNKELASIERELLERLHGYQPIEGRVRGQSMVPSFKEGDLLGLEPFQEGSWRMGDIVVYRREHRYVVHRIVGKKIDGKKVFFRLKGDANFHCDPPVPAEEILAKVVLRQNTLSKGWAEFHLWEARICLALDVCRNFLSRGCSPSVMKWALLFLSSLAIVLREPRCFSEPRFWAEEGVDFANAYGHSWINALFARPQDYFEVYTRIAGILAAKTVPIERAPLVTTLLAFAAQLIPLAIILWSRSNLWNTSLKKIIGLGIVLFTPPSGAAWLTTAQSQRFFAVTVFLLLLEEPPLTTTRKWSYRFLLFLSGLSGIHPCLLTPLFLFKAKETKNREDLIHCLLLTICCFVQAAWFVTALFSHPWVTASRLHLPSPYTYAVILWVRAVAHPLLGIPSAQFFVDKFSTLLVLGGLIPWVYGFLLALLSTATLILLSGWIETKGRITFLGAYLLLVLPSIALVKEDKAPLLNLIPGYAGEHFYACNVVLMLLLFSNISFSTRFPQVVRSSLFASLLGISLLLGAQEYTQTFKWFDWGSGPKWQDEVLAWKRDPSYRLQAWPKHKWWKLTLAAPQNVP